MGADHRSHRARLIVTLGAGDVEPSQFSAPVRVSCLAMRTASSPVIARACAERCSNSSPSASRAEQVRMLTNFMRPYRPPTFRAPAVS